MKFVEMMSKEGVTRVLYFTILGLTGVTWVIDSSILWLLFICSLGFSVVYS